MKKFVAGLVLGLLLSAGASRADWDWIDTGVLKEVRTSAQQIHLDLALIKVELQRIANAQDRLVSQQSGATRAEVEKRNQ